MLCAYSLSCNAYYEEQLDKMEPQWNYWLGKTKDERVMKQGPPDKCAALTDGGEVCEWRAGGVSGGGSYSAHTGYGASSVSSWEHRRIFVYDRDHVTQAWTYRGVWGERSSKNPSAPTKTNTIEEGKN